MFYVQYRIQMMSAGIVGQCTYYCLFQGLFWSIQNKLTQNRYLCFNIKIIIQVILFIVLILHFFVKGF
jgi:hypothetical protein